MFRSLVVLRLAASPMAFAPNAALRRRLQISPLQARDGSSELEVMAAPGCQSFRKLRKLGAVLVDETEFAWDLAQWCTSSMIIRPGCQGKTLMLDTIAELFAADAAELFQGTAIEDKVKSPAWHARPVIRMNFGGKDMMEGEGDRIVAMMQRYDISIETAQTIFVERMVGSILIRELRANAERLGVMDDVFVEEAAERRAANGRADAANRRAKAANRHAEAAKGRAEAAKRHAEEAERGAEMAAEERRVAVEGRRSSLGRIKELEKEKEHLEETGGSEAEMAAIEAKIETATTTADEDAATARRAMKVALNAGDAVAAAAGDAVAVAGDAAAAANAATAAAIDNDTSGSPRSRPVSIDSLFKRLLSAAADQHKASMEGHEQRGGGEVAVLIDDYDLPFTGVLDAPGGMKDVKLKAVWSVLADFFYLLRINPDVWGNVVVGATRFELDRRSVSSRIDDVTSDWAFATVTGFTQMEIKETYPKRLKALATRKFAGDDDAMWTWLTENYGGIRYCDDSGVEAKPLYNTWDIQNCLARLENDHFWAGTAGPAWLPKAATRSILSLPESAGELTESDKEAYVKIDAVCRLLWQEKRLFGDVFRSTYQGEQDAACWALRQAGILTICEVGRNANFDAGSDFDLQVGVPNLGSRKALVRLLKRVVGLEDENVAQQIREAIKEGQAEMLLNAAFKNAEKQESRIDLLADDRELPYEPTMTAWLSFTVKLAFLDHDGGSSVMEAPLPREGGSGPSGRTAVLVYSDDFVIILEAKAVERRDNRPDGAGLEQILGKKTYEEALQQTRGYHTALSETATNAISTGNATGYATGHATDVPWSASSQIGAFLFVMERGTGRLLGVETVKEFTRVSAET